VEPLICSAKGCRAAATWALEWTIEREICSDIGGGFAMDDYVMRLDLDSREG
jgi:hypothetical protein